MNVGYAKIGRAWETRLERASVVGGDVDVIRALHRLMAQTDDTYVLVGKTRTDPREVFPGVEAPWYTDEALMSVRRGIVRDQMKAMEPYAKRLDALVIWLGQIGGAATALPKLDGSGPIKPLEMDVNYAAYICRLVNVWRYLHPDRDVIWLVPDARNRLALHDFRDPPTEPLLAQYDMTRNGVHFAPTVSDPQRFVRAVHRFVYGAVELCSIPDLDQWTPRNILPRHQDRVPFGVVANENKRGKHNRGALLKEWVEDLGNVPLYGTWSDAGREELGRREPIPVLPYNDLYATAKCWRTTITLPASGSGWATSKPWEMFSVGTICFFHPAYDDQGHIVALDPTQARSKEEALLSAFLRPSTGEEFRRRLRAVNENPALYYEIARAQHVHLTRRYVEEQAGLRMTLDRLSQIRGGK